MEIKLLYKNDMWYAEVFKDNMAWRTKNDPDVALKGTKEQKVVDIMYKITQGILGND